MNYFSLSLSLFVCDVRVWEKIAESLQLVASTQGKLKSRISSLAKNVGFRAKLQQTAGVCLSLLLLKCTCSLVDWLIG